MNRARGRTVTQARLQREILRGKLRSMGVKQIESNQPTPQKRTAEKVLRKKSEIFSPVKKGSVF
jgi:hypothetical protein